MIKTSQVNEIFPGLQFSVLAEGQTESLYRIHNAITHIGQNFKALRLEVFIEDVVKTAYPAVFHVDTRKNVILKVPFNGVYSCKPQTVWNNGCSFVTPISNNMRLLRIEPAGKITTIRFSVVSQKGEYYGVVEVDGQYQAYRDGNNIAIPALNWPSLKEKVLDRVLSTMSSDDLPDISEYREAKPRNSGLSGNEGRVLFYNIGEGYGAVTLHDGRTARVHYSEIPPRGVKVNLASNIIRKGLAYLRPDEVIKFGYVGLIEQDPNRRPTTFKLEIKYVDFQQYEELALAE